MVLRLADNNAAALRAWRDCFRASPEVLIERGDVWTLARGAVVVAVDSSGVIRGGGSGLVARLRIAIDSPPRGSAWVIATGDAALPACVITVLDARNGRVARQSVYAAMRDALAAAAAGPLDIAELWCGGLGVGDGVPAEFAAANMAEAYVDWLATRTIPSPSGLIGVNQH